ncbi:MAG: TusE/DsrC/DsvC family sulfur relay protein [Pseudomonadota bacterium]|nr:TusE/DsrC/DsvC family sulfur relay protein [Pseudomonadota bacterium]
MVNYLRSEFIENAGNQPNTHTMNKDMGKTWGEKISSKELFDLFPGGPGKQAGWPSRRSARESPQGRILIASSLWGRGVAHMG